jgi:hypothetical protein
VIAYKFLREGALAPFSRERWPEPNSDCPGGWVEADGPLETCLNGVHACPPEALSYWFDDELWTVELEGEVLRQHAVLVARRGRLLGRVEGWPAVSLAFAEECAERALQRAADNPEDSRLGEISAETADEAARAAQPEYAVMAAYCAAVAADIVEPGGFDIERAWQSNRLAALLGLPASPPDASGQGD